MLIENVDQRSKDYGEIARQYRPAMPTMPMSEIRHPRPSRRRPLLGARRGARGRRSPGAQGGAGLVVRGALVSMGEREIDRARWNWNFVDDPENPFFTPDPESVPVFAAYLDGIRKAGSSVGAVIEIVAEGVPPALARRSTPSSTRTSPPADVDQRRQGRGNR